jgi:hypothetical protein
LRYIAPSFKRLERLFVGFDTSLSPVPSPLADDEKAIETVRSFHPLKFLQLRGPRSVCSLYRILNKHGKSLKGLAIQPSPAIRKDPGAERYRGYKYPYLDSEATNNLTDLCPKLEELRVQVKRSAGSAAECAVYRALGRFALLRNDSRSGLQFTATTGR